MSPGADERGVGANRLGVISAGRPGVVTVTRQQVQERTRAIALRAGRMAPHVLQADYEQAKREMTGTAEPERQEAILDAARDVPVRDRWA